MTIKQSLTKSSTVLLSAAFLATTLLPVASANAHDPSNWRKHKGKSHIHQNGGNRRYKKQKRNRNGDLIAAGIIGLAIGAIIASESSKSKKPKYGGNPPVRYQYGAPNYRGNPPVQQSYNEPYYNGSTYGSNAYGNSQYIPLENYQQQYQPQTSSNQGSYNNGPEVITFNDTQSFEPWTPGWRAWCENKFRSFNPQTGTYRGYDGFDHFCVPK